MSLNNNNHDIDEEKKRNLVVIQLADLSSHRRDAITKADIGSRQYNVPLHLLKSSRAVNKEGTAEAELYNKNKAQIAGWTDLHKTIGNDTGQEDLDNMLDGQTHRARLNERVRNEGGQRYDFEQHLSAVPRSQSHQASRGGSAARGGRGGGVIGTRGRIFRGGSNGHVPTQGSDRPLDPAVDPDRVYEYKDKVGRKSMARPYDATSAAGTGHQTGRRIASAPSKAGMAPAIAKARPPVHQIAPPAPLQINCDQYLDPAKFMEAVNAATSRKGFDATATSTPKLAKCTDTAIGPEVAVEKPEKNTDTKTNLSQQDEEQIQRSQIRQGPAHELSFPLAYSRSKSQADDGSSWTGGHPSPVSEDFPQSSPQKSFGQPIQDPSRLANAEASRPGGENGAEMSNNTNDTAAHEFETNMTPSQNTTVTSEPPAQSMNDIILIDLGSDPTGDSGNIEAPKPVDQQWLVTSPPSGTYHKDLQELLFADDELRGSESGRAKPAESIIRDGFVYVLQGPVSDDPKTKTFAAPAFKKDQPSSPLLTETTGAGLLGDRNLPRTPSVVAPSQTAPVIESAWAYNETAPVLENSRFSRSETRDFGDVSVQKNKLPATWRAQPLKDVSNTENLVTAMAKSVGIGDHNLPGRARTTSIFPDVATVDLSSAPNRGGNLDQSGLWKATQISNLFTKQLWTLGLDKQENDRKLVSQRLDRKTHLSSLPSEPSLSKPVNITTSEGNKHAGLVAAALHRDHVPPQAKQVQSMFEAQGLGGFRSTDAAEIAGHGFESGGANVAQEIQAEKVVRPTNSPGAFSIDLSRTSKNYQKDDKKISESDDEGRLRDLQSRDRVSNTSSSWTNAQQLPPSSASNPPFAFAANTTTPTSAHASHTAHFQTKLGESLYAVAPAKPSSGTASSVPPKQFAQPGPQLDNPFDRSHRSISHSHLSRVNEDLKETRGRSTTSLRGTTAKPSSAASATSDTTSHWSSSTATSIARSQKVQNPIFPPANITANPFSEPIPRVVQLKPTSYFIDPEARVKPGDRKPHFGGHGVNRKGKGRFTYDGSTDS